MGQYYMIANIDKKEYIDAFQFGSGVKLMEFSYCGNGVVNYMLQLMMDKWKGNRVYIIGDYADNFNMDECWADTYVKACKSIGVDEGEEGNLNLYEYISDNFKQIAVRDLNVEEPHYVYNTRIKSYLDLEHANIAWAYRSNNGDNKGVAKYSDISLLLTMGNGRGGGDYRSEVSEYLVGSWCEYSEDLIVSGEKLAEYADYEEFNPDFYEEDAPMPYTLESSLYEAMDKMVLDDPSKDCYYISSFDAYSKIKGM